MNSVYIHIPFCNTICSYCDFCKQFYNELNVDKYLIELEQEIKKNYKGEVIKTIYIGGGTPSCLNIKQLNKLFEIIDIFNKDLLEFTIECNVDVSFDKIKLFKKNGVNRISIGIETVNCNHLKTLNRFHSKVDIIEKINFIKKIGIDNINVDLMYALPNETLEDLKEDIDFLISLDVNHISTYSLIIEPHTKLYIDKVKYTSEDLDYEMYKLINETLISNDFIHYEISNYSKKGYESKHNLVYWNNEKYYGFGLGASGYIDDLRYDNTRSLTNYLSGKHKYNLDNLSLNDIIEYELILGFRKTKGININDFKSKYNLDLECICFNLIKEGKLIKDGEYIKINPLFIYVSNSILIEFVGELYEGKSF